MKMTFSIVWLNQPQTTAEQKRPLMVEVKDLRSGSDVWRRQRSRRRRGDGRLCFCTKPHAGWWLQLWAEDENAENGGRFLIFVAHVFWKSLWFDRDWWQNPLWFWFCCLTTVTRRCPEAPEPHVVLSLLYCGSAAETWRNSFRNVAMNVMNHEPVTSYSCWSPHSIQQQ